MHADADEETRVKQALQNYSREQALACLWESGSLVASASASSDLAADWEHTYWNVLDQEQRKVRGHLSAHHRLLLAMWHDQTGVQVARLTVSIKLLSN